MTKIYFNYTEESNLLYPLKNAETSLSKAINVCSWLDIPNSFKYKNYVQDLEVTLKKHLDVITGSYNCLVNSAKGFLKSQENIENLLIELDQSGIKLRQTVIK